MIRPLCARRLQSTVSLLGMTVIALALSVAGCSALPASAESLEQGDLVVTLLGTGTPALKPDRFGAAYLVQAGGKNLLIDAGRGASIRLQQAGVTPGAIDAVFLTHFHSDHVNGLADIYLVGYINASTLKARSRPFQLYGPTGTRALAEGLVKAHQSDSETRIIDEGVAKVATQITAYENDSGVIYEEDGVTVTTFPVLHGENIKASVGYRVDYDGKSVVFSGDTKFEPNLIKFGKGVDLLIHEVAMATEALASKPVIQKILAHHTSPEEVGTVFKQAAPKLAVYSHMVLLGSPPVSEVIARTRQTYNGQLVIGEDLMQFLISDQGVTLLKAGR